MKTIIISAYACEPNEGSEPGVGWNWILSLSKHFNVIAITRKNNKIKIDKYLERNECLNVKFYYCDIPKWLSRWKKGQKGIYLYYFLWQKKCYRLAKKLCKEFKVHYAMSLTFGNMWLPTLFDKLPCFFIWGPLGGGEGVPKLLLNAVSKKQRFFEKIRKINQILPITNLRFKNICKNSKIIITRTKDSYDCIPKKYQHKCLMILETGISKEDILNFKKIVKTNFNKNEEFVINGRMVPFKLFPLALYSLERIISKYPNARLNIIGDGPEKDKLINLTKKLKIEKNVIFHGKVDRIKALEIMNNCQAVIVTSAREGGSWVLFEAMLLKKPIICFKTSGMEMMVDNNTGFLIDVVDFKEAIDLFAQKMECTLNNIEKVRELGENAYTKITNEFTWDSKVKTLMDRIKKIEKEN